jgi:hypothetical protein
MPRHQVGRPEGDHDNRRARIPGTACEQPLNDTAQRAVAADADHRAHTAEADQRLVRDLVRLLDERVNRKPGGSQALLDPHGHRPGAAATRDRIHKQQNLFHTADPTGMMLSMKFDNWRQQFDFIDSVMKSVSGISDPQEMVNLYGDAIDQLFPVDDWMAVSRRGLEFPAYRITRSSRYDRDFNPWKQRDELPILRGGLLGEIAYANKPW